MNRSQARRITPAVSASSLAAEIAERIGGLGTITVGRYFGGAGLRAEGRLFGFVMKGVLYLRVDEVGRRAWRGLGSAPFTYSGAHGEVSVEAFYAAPTEILEDDAALNAWGARAIAAADAGATPRPTRNGQ